MGASSGGGADGPRAGLTEEFRTLLSSDLARARCGLLDRLTLITIRLAQSSRGRRGPAPMLLRLVARALNAVVIRTIAGGQIPVQVRIGPGLLLPHGARGVVMHPYVRIGAGATIYHEVTIGILDALGEDNTVLRANPAPPVLGDHVYVGAGAKVLGDIRVADRTRIGANAVILRDTEPGATYVGNPAVQR